MGGVDLSDALTLNYNVLQKTQKWYKTFFYHLLDIAVVNAYILHRELSKYNGVVALDQKAFREALVEGLAEAGAPSTTRPPPGPSASHHKPEHISGHSTTGRLKCRHCHSKTPVKCSSCNVALCLVPQRDRFNSWHCARNL